ncbi:flavodoxin family protein [Desulfospira joergensenii]|uniref:flavodoxin family protein n=1 Tax=Desulfospira joergensenii TaxID=53329 RepID=UPI0003B668C6|nr:NAD(P)H-dependent oxidoreductase [Desulfospira joergensenii]
MKILVLYYSKGGNTKKLAQSVLEGVNSVAGVEGVLKDTRSVTKEDFLEAGGIIAGSPVYFGTMAAQLKQVFDDFISTRRKMEGKVGAVFATSGDPTGGKETTMFSIIQALMIYGMVITGDPMSATGHYGTACAGEPDEKTLENGIKLGQRVGELGLKLKA